MPSVVLAISSISNIITAKRIPLIPATEVSTILSLMICPRMLCGVAPIARRMPISVVRSFTVTIMMFETPMAPANNVPIPTSHISKLTPENKLSTNPNITSVLNTVTAFSSVGSIWCARATTSRMRGAILLITTPGLAVALIK